MAWPASLTLVTVAIRFDVPPSGGAYGKVTFTLPTPLNGPTDGSTVPAVSLVAYLVADGTASIQLPATNDPDWTPTGWAYVVDAQVAGSVRTGTLQLDYQTTSVQLADLVQWDGTVVAGQTYIPLSYRGAANGVASLGSDGKVPAGQIPDVGAAIPLSQKAAANGVATLDGTTHIPVAQLPDLSGTYLPLTGGTITGNVGVQDASTPTKAYRFRTNGSNLDIEGTGADIFLSVWSGTAFNGSQRNYARLEAGAGLAHALGRWLFAAGAFDGTGVADLDPSTGVAAVGAKNSLTNVRVCGQKATSGAPTTGTWAVGDSVVDSVGRLWQCTGAGTPGTWTTPVLVLGPVDAVPAGTAAGTVIVRTAS